MAKIVVGVDGSDASRAALRWAIRESRLRRADIVAVHAWSFGHPSLWDGDNLVDVDWEGMAQEVLDDSVDDIAIETGALIQKRLVRRAPADALVRAAEDADLIVLGTHGYGVIRGIVFGSVGKDCMKRATCPVVVIPANEIAA